jgi:hypothetical protein
MNIDKSSDRELEWSVGIQVTLILTGVLHSVMDRVFRRGAALISFMSPDWSPISGGYHGHDMKSHLNGDLKQQELRCIVLRDEANMKAGRYPMSDLVVIVYPS